MTRFWRICRLQYAAQVATGEGARLFGGRWNSAGVRVVYTSSSLALAAMETFVNLPLDSQPTDLVSVEGEIPDGLRIEQLNPENLHNAWNETRDQSLRTLGDEWIRNAETVAIRVPSAAIRGEWNILLNPAHPAFSKIALQRPQPFQFDLRMFR